MGGCRAGVRGGGRGEVGPSLQEERNKKARPPPLKNKPLLKENPRECTRPSHNPHLIPSPPPPTPPGALGAPDAAAGAADERRQRRQRQQAELERRQRERRERQRPQAQRAKQQAAAGRSGAGLGDHSVASPWPPHPASVQWPQYEQLHLAAARVAADFGALLR